MKAKLVIAFMLIICSCGWAARKAIVIGNANYSSSPLRNSINDAQLIASTLKELDFRVNLVIDADLQNMDYSLNKFINDLTSDDEVVFYYSGHGANFNGENYLIPIGREFRDDKELKYCAFSSNMALDLMQCAKTTVMILDACRDNPFRGIRSASKGLAIMHGKAGSQYIIYSTELGKTAADGTGVNSPFTESFVKHIKTPGSIEEVMKKVTLEVKTKTNDNQIPWTAGNLIEDFYFTKATPKSPQSSQDDVKVKSEFHTGTISVESAKAGEIWLDGVYKSKIDPSNTIKLELVNAGEHQIELKQNDLIELRRVTVKKNLVANVRFDDRKSMKEMVNISSGSFTMGRTLGNGKSDELPSHSVTLDSFYMCKYPVTQSEWVSIMGYNPASGRSVGEMFPVYEVSWYAAIKYCNLLSIEEGLEPVYRISGTTSPDGWGNIPLSMNSIWDSVECKWEANGYRLPTEAEWEYAASGADNNQNFIYSGSNNINDVGWYEKNNMELFQITELGLYKDNPNHDDVNRVFGTFDIKPVGKKQSNTLGLYDMSGNVYEWCWDWYGEYKDNDHFNPTGQMTGIHRVMRGGCFCSTKDNCRVVSRFSYYPHTPYCFTGFRLVRSTY